MFSKFNLPSMASIKHVVGHSGNFLTVAHHTFRGLLATAKQTLMLLGLISLCMVGLVYAKPESLHRIQASLARISPAPAAQASQPINHQSNDSSNALAQGDSPANPANSDKQLASNSSTSAANSSAESPAKSSTQDNDPFKAGRNAHKFGISTASINPNLLNDPNLQQQQQWVASWLSKRYHIANDATLALVGTTYQTGLEIQVDPLLILAVAAIESGFNPIAESPMGAQGLMQVMSKVHHARFQKLGGIKEALNPVSNIKVGAMILRDFVVRGGSVEAGLKSYVGAAAFVNDAGYGSRVLAEYARLKQVAGGKAVPTAIAPVMPIARKAEPVQEEAKAEIGKDQMAAL